MAMADESVILNISRRAVDEGGGWTVGLQQWDEANEQIFDIEIVAEGYGTYNGRARITNVSHDCSWDTRELCEISTLWYAEPWTALGHGLGAVIGLPGYTNQSDRMGDITD